MIELNCNYVYVCVKLCKETTDFGSSFQQNPSLFSHFPCENLPKFTPSEDISQLNKSLPKFILASNVPFI